MLLIGTQYWQSMPHSHPNPPPIATLHHSPALSASSLESTSIFSSPPITQPSTPYHPHPAHALPMSQAPPYPYQPNGAMSRYPDDSQPGYPPHPASARNIRPTMVAAQPYPGPANYIDDASTKLSDRIRRKCYNCRTTDTSTWRQSSLTPGKVLCNKCGLFERTHSRPRSVQPSHKRVPAVNVNQFKQHHIVHPQLPTCSPSSSSSSQAQAVTSDADQAASSSIVGPHEWVPPHGIKPSGSPLEQLRRQHFNG
ncbi:hypothetical protein LXA43DRAFT_900367 [Ganoderma leucocontextum]|nr:hypothetical protein LXA43DRAFT_900367 [Ganoderma leucocontextum]